MAVEQQKIAAAAGLDTIEGVARGLIDRDIDGEARVAKIGNRRRGHFSSLRQRFPPAMPEEDRHAERPGGPRLGERQSEPRADLRFDGLGREFRDVDESIPRQDAHLREVARVAEGEVHDPGGVGRTDQLSDGPPLQPTPAFLRILRTEKDDDQVGLRAVEIGEIDIKVRARELRIVELVVQHPVLPEPHNQALRDRSDPVVVLPRKRKCHAESLRRGRIS